MQLGVVGIDGPVDAGVHMGIHRPRQAVGDGGDEVPPRTAVRQHPSRVGAYLLRGRVRPVDSRAHAAHQHQPSVQTALQGGDVVLRQHTLPHLNAALRHILHDGGQIGVCVVDGDAAPGADVSVEPAVRLLEERPPHLGLHEQGVLGAPVVVGEDHVRAQAVDQQLHIGQPVFQNVLDEVVHLLRMLVKAGQCVLEAHEEVALLKDAGAHEPRQQPLLAAGGPGLLPAGLPAVGTVRRQIRRVYRRPPACHVRAHRQTVLRHRHRPRRILRKADGGAPAIHADGAPLPVAPQVGIGRVVQAHIQRLVLPQLPLRLAVRLQKLQKVLFCCHHGALTSQRLLTKQPYPA